MYKRQIQYGLIPEFVGRFPIVANLAQLSEQDLIRILIEPKNALTRQYEKLLRMSETALVFTPCALRAMAQAAIKNKTGARGLRAVLEKLMLDVMFEAPRKGTPSEIRITGDMVRRHSIHADRHAARKSA